MGTRRKRSPVWKVDTETLSTLVKDSSTFTAVLSGLGLRNVGGNYRTLKNRLANDGIRYDHIPLGLNCNRGRAVGGVTQIPLHEILTTDSAYARSHLKRRLLCEGILKNECSECGQKPEWCGKILVMVLDHINGVANDNRLENLRLLCPNCNSQTTTFAGRNVKRV